MVASGCCSFIVAACECIDWATLVAVIQVWLLGFAMSAFSDITQRHSLVISCFSRTLRKVSKES